VGEKEGGGEEEGGLSKPLSPVKKRTAERLVRDRQA
jgi:hypothetical protein